MRIENHPILNFDRGKKVTFYYNGQQVEGYENETVAQALHAAGIRRFDGLADVVVQIAFRDRAGQVRKADVQMRFCDDGDAFHAMSLPGEKEEKKNRACSGFCPQRLCACHCRESAERPSIRMRRQAWRFSAYPGFSGSLIQIS